MRKHKKKLNIFDLPVAESRLKLQDIIGNVYSILESEKFVRMSTKVDIPRNATKKQIEDLVRKNGPLKIKEFLELFLIDKFDDVVKICATIFCEEEEEYKQKNIKEILKDFETLSKDEAGQLLGFFTRAGK